MSRIRIPLVGMLLMVLLSLSTIVSAASSQRFCRCTCFKNSTIIPLTLTHDPTNDKDPNPPPKDSKPGEKDTDNKPAPSSPPPPAPPPGNTDRDPCKQCNIAFCLSNTLPICKDADPEKDVKTFCFQRDRTEDQVIVWSFILGTLGLLGWAGIRGVVEARDRREMAAQAAAQQQQGGGGSSSLPFNSGVAGGGDAGGGGLWQRILGLGGRTGRGQGGGTYVPLDDTAR